MSVSLKGAINPLHKDHYTNTNFARLRFELFFNFFSLNIYYTKILHE